jgi:hypothetical protein
MHAMKKPPQSMGLFAAGAITVAAKQGSIITHGLNIST